MRIVVPDDFPPAYQGYQDLERLAPYGEVVLYDTKASNPQELIERLRGATATINVRAYSIFDRPIFEVLPDLKIISILGTGTDNIDLQAATDHGVAVANAPGASTVSVAELSVILMMNIARHVALMDRLVRINRWHHVEGVELRGKTLGLVGLGAIGQDVATIARALGMDLLAWSMTEDEDRANRIGATMVELPELLARSDFVSLHLRLSPQTMGIIGEKDLALMKPTAFLINTARGALVDEKALFEALSRKRIAGAGLDVFITEPLPEDSPFFSLDNVVLTPHCGWVTAEASVRLRKLPVDNLIAFFEGSPTNIVNPAALR